MNDIQIIFDNMLMQDLLVVLKVAEFRSITAAATSLDMSAATASAALKRVERSLGVELFIRTTRSLRLSSAGEKYIPNCMQALEMLDKAKQGVKNDLDVVDGELRIGLSSDFGRNFVVSWLDDFMHEHPGVHLKTNISDSAVDFYRDSIDIAIRYAPPQDSNLYGFKICDVPRVLCASNDYVEKNGFPKYPDDLMSHNGLFYQLYDVIYNVWEFANEGQTFKVNLQGNRVSNDGDLVRRWCVSGKGVALKSCLDVSSDLLAGRLINLLPDFKSPATELWLICPSRQSITPAVRLLRDMLREKTRDILRQLIQQGFIDADILD